MKNIFILIVIYATILGCEKEKLSNGHSDLIVVQGYLYAGKTIDSIRLSQAVQLNSADTLFHGITNAAVTISTGGKTYNLVASEKEGYYHCNDSSLKIFAGNTYTLDIAYNNQHITAKTIVPETPKGLSLSSKELYVDTSSFMFNPNDTSNTLTVRWNNPTKEYYFLITEHSDSTLVPITIVISFNGRTDTISRSNFINRFQTSPVQDSTFRISTNSVGYYGKYTVKLYKVTKDYASLYQSRTQSSTNLNEPFSNITNGLGIFTSFSACDSLSFNVVKK